LLPGVLPPKYLCAALIAESWAFFHDEEPPPKNQHAAAAADAFWHASGHFIFDGIKHNHEANAADSYWRALGNKATSWGGDRLNGWRPYLEKAGAPSLAATRAEFRRHLVEAKRRG
jgi:hypothetical protein